MCLVGVYDLLTAVVFSKLIYSMESRQKLVAGKFTKLLPYHPVYISILFSLTLLYGGSKI